MEFEAAALAVAAVQIELLDPLGPFGSLGVEVAKDTEGPFSGEGSHEGCNFLGRPCRELVAFDYILGEFFEVVIASGVLDLHDSAGVVRDRGPLVRERGSVNPGSVYEGVKVKVPAVPLVGYLDRVESTAPVRGEGRAAQRGEAPAEFVHVVWGECFRVLECEGDVLRLFDCSGPPLDGAAAFVAEVGLALGAAEQVTPIWEFLGRAAPGALGDRVRGVTVPEFEGKVVQPDFVQFGGDGELVDGPGLPELLVLPRLGGVLGGWWSLLSYPPCLKLNGARGG